MIDFRFPDSFHQPPLNRTVGDTDEKTLYLAVGKALTAWEYIDEAVARVFHELCDTDSYASLRVYGSLVSNTGKQGLLEAAAEIYFQLRGSNEQQISLINHLIIRFGKLHGLRNNIAHGQVVRFANDTTDHGYFLIPTDYTRKTIALPDLDPTNPLSIFGRKYTWTSVEVNEIYEKFKMFGEKIREYNLHLRSTFPVRPFRSARQEGI